MEFLGFCSHCSHSNWVIVCTQRQSDNPQCVKSDTSIVPRPPLRSCCLQYRKAGEQSSIAGRSTVWLRPTQRQACFVTFRFQPHPPAPALRANPFPKVSDLFLLISLSYIALSTQRLFEQIEDGCVLFKQLLFTTLVCEMITPTIYMTGVCVKSCLVYIPSFSLLI